MSGHEPKVRDANSIDDTLLAGASREAIDPEDHLSRERGAEFIGFVALGPSPGLDPQVPLTFAVDPVACREPVQTTIPLPATVAELHLRRAGNLRSRMPSTGPV